MTHVLKGTALCLRMRARDRMSVLLVLMGLCVLLRISNCGPAPQEKSGCLQWNKKGEEVCCDHCQPDVLCNFCEFKDFDLCDITGNRLVFHCGLDPKLLCTPCKEETFTSSTKAERCQRCKQCIDPQMLVKRCSSSQDTECGCKRGFLCGDSSCSFCIQECGPGQEPTDQRGCEPCPHGKYNDQTHHKCKPWTRCDKNPVKQGDAFSDATCGNVSALPALPVVVPEPNEPRQPADGPSLILCIMFGVAVPSLLIAIIVMAITQIKQKKKKKQKPEPETAVKNPPIITYPTDEPQTLIAIECSFHEAEQEQGCSSESLLPGQ